MIADCGHILTSRTALRRLDDSRNHEPQAKDDITEAGPRPTGTEVIRERRLDRDDSNE